MANRSKHIFLWGLASLLAWAAHAERREVQIIKADAARNIRVGDDNINRLIGNVILYHNKTLMNCDSAYLYPDQRFEAFSRVVIHKDSTWLYGDYMDYRSAIDVGKVRGKIVTLIDGKNRLRTQFLDFNTAENTGYFWDGGVIDNEDNLLESKEGMYYSNEKKAVFYREVEMKNKEYRIQSDSLHYLTQLEKAIFFKQTYLWGDSLFMSCQYGYYDRPADHVFLANNAYAQTNTQEAWSDSAHYYKAIKTGYFYNNVQMTDTVQRAILFGDYGKMSEAPQQRAFVTQQASAALYGEKTEDDTLFVRGDTLLVYTLPRPTDTAATISTLPQSTDAPLTSIKKSLAIDTATKIASIKNDSLLNDTTVLALLPDTLRKDSVALLALQDTLPKDSVALLALQDTLTTDSLAAEPQDSLLRFFEAYYNVRFFHPDISGKCDSFIYKANDSLGEMHYLPVIWNADNQMTAERIDIHQKNNQIHQVELVEAAFLAAADDSIRQFFNQIKGVNMVGHFANNDLYRIDVFSAGQTIYYMRDKGKISGVNKASSTDIVISMKDRKIQKIDYITQPEADVIPPREIRAKVSELKLRGFSWQSAIRPHSRWEICRRTVKPSRRHECSLFPLPTFAVYELILNKEKSKEKFKYPKEAGLQAWKKD
ncbi:hypothetical protein FACS1894156_4630 [Bacteroidia bacterium]|nr:hypothetical protein FACS1894156_4630 [Bacteroidia bacterium]